MKLIFIYGPPASGKLTVANEISETTDFGVYHNHMMINNLASIFPYEDPKLNKIRSRLGKKLALEIFEEAAVANVSFITTLGNAGHRYFEFLRGAQAVVEKHGGEFVLVHLFTDEATLMERVELESRKKHKIDSKAFLKKYMNDNPEILDSFPDYDHLEIDNTNLSAKEAARLIMGHME